MAGGANRIGDVLLGAMAALDNGRPEQAESIANQVLREERNHGRALYILGCALLMQNRPADAIVPLEAAARGRHDPEFDTMMAIALRRVGQNEDALRRLKLATKRQPPYAVAFKELGHLLVSMQRYDEAVEALKRGIEVAPMMPQLFVQLGYAYFSLRNFDDAKTTFSRALDISPGSLDALFGIARSHQEVGENAAAVDYFRRYLLARPSDDAAWLHLGHCLLELGQLEAGYDCFRTAARGDAKRYGSALSSLAAAARGRFWIRPSDAARFMRSTKN